MTFSGSADWIWSILFNEFRSLQSHGLCDISFHYISTVGGLEEKCCHFLIRELSTSTRS